MTTIAGITWHWFMMVNKIYMILAIQKLKSEDWRQIKKQVYKTKHIITITRQIFIKHYFNY